MAETKGRPTTGDGGRRGLVGRLAAALSRRLNHQLWNIGYGWGPRLRSAIRKRWIVFSHPHANIQFGPGVHIAPGFSLYVPHGGSFIVGAGTEFRIGFRAEVAGNGRVVIGRNCTFSYYSLIQISGLLEIGDGCGFGQSSAIFDGKHSYDDLDKPFMHQGFDLRPIRIGNECGVLTKVTVLNDIGDRCVIGANSVVVDAIPSYSVAVGAPARVVQYFGPDGEPPAELAAADAAE